jgi:[ribosomal protein S5]-alanine N-acetyltransferase
MSEMPAFQSETRLDMYLDLELPPENSKIHLFLLKPDHVTQEYVSWLNDPEVNKFLECRFSIHTIETTKNFVQTILDSPSYLFLGIYSRLLSRHIGNIKIGPIDVNHGTGEIGIMLGDKGSWGKGIGSMAFSMISEIARKQLLLRKVSAGCYVLHKSSQKMFKKSGFIVETLRKKHYLFNGKPVDEIIMSKFLR